MDKGTIVFFFGIMVGNFLLATEWAKYGIMEIGIQRPINKRVIAGMLIGVGTVFIGGIMNRFYGFDPYNCPYRNYVIAVVVGIPVLWMIFFRYVLLPPGLFDFNKAKIRTFYWVLSNYRPGTRNPEEKAKNLREFGHAEDAVRRFKKAIRLQLRGENVHRIERVLEITGDMYNPYHNSYRINCPACPFPIEISAAAEGQNLSGMCGVCGSFVTARVEGGKIYLAADLTKPIRIVRDKNRYNAAVAYEELALLYRMMNMFDKALDSLGKGMEIAKELLGREPGNKKYLHLKSMIIFRRAEINHLLKNTEEARAGYEESLSIDRELGDEEDVRTIEMLLKKL